jgi:hypothetical protein
MAGVTGCLKYHKLFMEYGVVGTIAFVRRETGNLKTIPFFSEHETGLLTTQL